MTRVIMKGRTCLIVAGGGQCGNPLAIKGLKRMGLVGEPRNVRHFSGPPLLL